MNAAAEFPNPNDPGPSGGGCVSEETRTIIGATWREGGADPEAAETFADCYAALVEGASSFARRKAATMPLAPCVRRSSN